MWFHPKPKRIWTNSLLISTRNTPTHFWTKCVTKKKHVTEKKRAHMYFGSYAGCKRVFYFTLPRANVKHEWVVTIDSNAYVPTWRAYGDVYMHEQVHVTLIPNHNGYNSIATILV